MSPFDRFESITECIDSLNSLENKPYIYGDTYNDYIMMTINNTSSRMAKLIDNQVDFIPKDQLGNEVSTWILGANSIITCRDKLVDVGVLYKSDCGVLEKYFGFIMNKVDVYSV